MTRSSALTLTTLLTAFVLLAGCEKKAESTSCSSYGMSGTPGMNLTAGGCPGDTSYAVKCEGEKVTCTCSKNGVDGKTFEPTDGKLPQDYNDAIKVVNTGCGWSIPPKE